MFYEVDSQVSLQHTNGILLYNPRTSSGSLQDECKELGQVARGSLWQWQVAILWGLPMWTDAPHDL